MIGQLVGRLAEGTRYENFVRDLAEKDIKGVRTVADEGKITFDSNVKATELFVEQITYAFYDSLFKPVVRGDDIETAKEYVSMMVEFYVNGLQKLIQ